MDLNELKEFANHTGVTINEKEQWSDVEQKMITIFEFTGGHLDIYPFYYNGGVGKMLKEEVFDDRVTPEILWDILIRGKDIEQITRVTGYYAQVGNFNPGKVGELRDRFRSGDVSGVRYTKKTS